MKPDYRLIHALEYELGFRDDPPPSRAPHTRTIDGLLKEAFLTSPSENPFSAAAEMKRQYLAQEVKRGRYAPPTDEPGAIIYYDPKQGRPTY